MEGFFFYPLLLYSYVDGITVRHKLSLVKKPLSTHNLLHAKSHSHMWQIRDFLTYSGSGLNIMVLV